MYCRPKLGPRFESESKSLNAQYWSVQRTVVEIPGYLRWLERLTSVPRAAQIVCGALHYLIRLCSVGGLVGWVGGYGW